MKNISVFLLSVLTIGLSAQDIQHEPLNRDLAVLNKVKSAKIIVLFLAEKDSTKGDTGVVEIQHYDMTGMMTNSVYACTLDKSNYRSTTYYTYYDNGSMKSCVVKELGEIVDSTFWYDTDHFYHMTNEPGLKVIRSMEGDSIFKELRITDNDSIEVRHKFKPQPKHELYEYDCNAYEYETHIYRHSSNPKTDTMLYYNSTGTLRLKLVVHFDTKGMPELYEYYNYGDLKARGFYAKYNNRLNLSDFIPMTPKGKCNYWITKSYSTNGLIESKRTFSTKKHYTPVKVIYTYEYY